MRRRDGEVLSVLDRRCSRSAAEHSLVVVHTVVGLAAVVGGVLLVDDRLGVPDAWLLRTPFDSWLIPGALLALGIGSTQVAAALLLGIGDPQGRPASMLASVALLWWAVVQGLVLPGTHAVEVLLLGIGLLCAAAAKHLPRLGA